MTDDPPEAEPIKPSPLWDFVRACEGDMQVGDGSRERLIQLMERTIELAWEEAANNARSNGSSTVNPEDVTQGYKSLFEPHDLLNDAAEHMKSYQRDFEEEVVSESPILSDQGDS